MQFHVDYFLYLWQRPSNTAGQVGKTIAGMQFSDELVPCGLSRTLKAKLVAAKLQFDAP
jgi:hypothetical protein